MKIVFMGTPQAAVPTLERLIVDGHEIVAVYTQPDRPSGRGNKITFSPVKEFALSRSIPVFQPTKVKTPEAAAEFASLNADVAVVVAYGRILPEAFLSAFSHGAINVHFSLLPKYRGAAPVNWAIINGETETGVTTMKMDAGLDTGDILLQAQTAIDPHENSIELMSRLSLLGAELCSQTIAELDSVVPRMQDHESASYAPLMKKSDGEINWTLSADAIERRVRGFQPFPTSYTFLKGKRVTIWNARRSFSEDQQTDTDFGKISEANSDRLIVTCGSNSSLQINEMQIEGKRRLHAREIISGGSIKAGDRFASRS